MSDKPTDWNLQWVPANDCYSLTRINNGGVEEIDLFVDEPTAKAAQAALNSHEHLVVACKAQDQLIRFYGILLANYRTGSRPGEMTLNEVNKATAVTDAARAALAKAGVA
mgnify:CR=1 FL=1